MRREGKKNTSMLCVCGITFEKYAERVSLGYAMFHWGDRFSLLEKLSLVKTHKKKKIGLHMHVVALRKIFYYNIIVFLIVVITLQLLLISLHRISTTRICHSFSPELKYTSVCCCVVQPTSVAYYPGSLKRLLVLRNLSIVVCEISTLQFISETEKFTKWNFSSNHR